MKFVLEIQCVEGGATEFMDGVVATLQKTCKWLEAKEHYVGDKRIICDTDDRHVGWVKVCDGDVENLRPC